MHCLRGTNKIYSDWPISFASKMSVFTFIFIALHFLFVKQSESLLYNIFWIAQLFPTFFWSNHHITDIIQIFLQGRWWKTLPHVEDSSYVQTGQSVARNGRDHSGASPASTTSARPCWLFFSASLLRAGQTCSIG